MNQSEINPRLNSIQLLAAIVGVIGLLAWAVAMFAFGGTRQQFFQSYLYAYLFWIAIPLGSFVLLMLQHMVHGMWGSAIRRLLEAAALTIPLMALVFVPIALFGINDLYLWANPDVIAHDVILQRKVAYLNVSFFLVRAALYYVIWTVFTLLLVKWSNDEDKTKDPAMQGRFRMLSGPGIALYVLTMTFAAFDWGMSLEPHWFSAIYGVIFMIGQGLSTFAFMIMIVALLANRKPMVDVLTTKHFHDLGNLLLAFTILWTYMSLSQFLIIWSGNLPEETPWYLHRQAGGWNAVAISVIVVQFVLPFFLLLQRFMKRKIQHLWKVALVIFLLRFVDLFWIIMPAFHDTVSSVPWMTYAAPIGVGGIWITVFVEILKRRPIVPVGDSHIQEALGHG